MADQTKNKASKAGPVFTAETQRERWLKYGANVALSVVVVVVLTLLVTYIGGRVGWRKDTTAAGAYSLKPQTVSLIGSLPQKVEIVGLFTKAKQEQEKRVAEDDPAVRYQQVADLLQEYQEKSNGKISVRMIDPITDPGKVDELFNTVAKKYGNDFKKYEDVMSAYPATIDKINAVAKQEIEALEKSPPKVTDQKMARVVGEVAVTVQVFPQILDGLRRDVKKQMELKVPDYKGAADAIRSSLEGLNDRIDGVLKQFASAKADPKTPAEFKTYMAAAEPRYGEMRKASDDLLKKIADLGELKQLDALRQNKTNSIAVLAENDLKVLPSASIFRAEDNRRAMAATDGKPKPRFAAEQQISTALVTLTAKDKKRVAFVRSGGEPATLSLPMFRFQGAYSEVADRLREYGMEVLEKDVSGQWQMQAMQMQMQQGVPLPPEATDEQLKGAVWIVMVSQQDPRQMMANPAGSVLGPKVSEHLRNGGSAMILVDPQAEKLDFLKEWGVETQPQYLVVHDKITATGARAEDVTQDWLRQQPVFVLNEFGDHSVTRPLRSLDALMVPLVPVKTVDAKGVKTTPILPVPNDPRTWGEADFDAIIQGKTATFDTTGDKADVPGPFFGGAIAEKDGGKGRLIVIGNRTFAIDEYQHIGDLPASKQQERFVARFPANAELFVNGVFWLTNMDTMIAISPTALEVPRVAAVGPGTLNVLRLGLLVIGLPALVLLAGALVFLKRRD